jgi:hypothetical protein
VEHLADELHARRLVRILLLELHNETKGAILERSISRANNDSIPLPHFISDSGTMDRSKLDNHQVMTLSAIGEAETPAGGSVCIRC